VTDGITDNFVLLFQSASQDMQDQTVTLAQPASTALAGQCLLGVLVEALAHMQTLMGFLGTAVRCLVGLG
jgi:hypothetical protein